MSLVTRESTSPRCCASKYDERQPVELVLDVAAQPVDRALDDAVEQVALQLAEHATRRRRSPIDGEQHEAERRRSRCRRPGTTCWLSITLATVALPAARACAAACSPVIPAGSCLPMTPAKITSVARPRMHRPDHVQRHARSRRAPARATTPRRSGRSRPTSRRADGPKSIAFSTGCPAPRPRRTAAAALGGHAARGCDRVGVLRRSDRRGFVGALMRPPPARVLRLDDLDVGRAGRQQLRVRALADDHAVVEHEDLVGVGDASTRAGRRSPRSRRR